MNNYQAIGNLVKDCELKSTSSGHYILSGTIAVNNMAKKDGQWIKEPSFFDFKWFGERAAKLNQYLLKGTQIGIEANLKQERWQDKDGNNRSKIILNINNVTLLGKKESSEPAHVGNHFEDEKIPF